MLSVLWTVCGDVEYIVDCVDVMIHICIASMSHPVVAVNTSAEVVRAATASLCVGMMFRLDFLCDCDSCHSLQFL